ncbi:MAG: GxxExxY protein [Anaerolineales bacterium]|nr:GxxExxY protein [Anaerolineales bacterium]
MDLERRVNQLSYQVIGAAVEVHKALGPGLLESTYEHCLAYELTMRQIPVLRQKQLPVVYKGERIDCGYRLDLLVDDLIIVELKCVDKFLPIHTAQLLTYLKLTDLPVGLLINFNVYNITQTGVKRVAHRLNP